MFHGIRLSLNHDTKVRKNIEICNFSGNFFCMNRVNLNQFLKDKNLPARLPPHCQPVCRLVRSPDGPRVQEREPHDGTEPRQPPPRCHHDQARIRERTQGSGLQTRLLCKRTHTGRNRTTAPSRNFLMQPCSHADISFYRDIKKVYS